MKKYTASPVPNVWDVFSDQNGVWVADYNYGVVRIAPDGTVAEFPTFAANSVPESVTTNAGNLYFADTISEGSENYVGGFGSVLESNW